MRGRLLILAVVVLAAFVPTGAAWASNYDVTLAADAVDISPGDDQCDSSAAAGGDQCTLRAAVMEANAHGGDDSITLTGATTYTLSVGAAGDNSGASGDLDIFGADTLTIVGAGADNSTIDAGSTGDRVFDIQPTSGAVVISDVKIRGGRTLTGTGPEGDGGGIRVQSSLSLLNAIVTENQANATTGRGGGIAQIGTSSDIAVSIVNSTIGGSSPGTENTAALGGGVAQAGLGTIIISNSRVIGNVASGFPVTGSRGGGAIETGGGILTIQFSEVSGNSVIGFAGGGVAANGSQGDVSILYSLVTGNTVTPSVGAAHGGGVAESGGESVTILDSTITGNSATGGGTGRGGGLSGTGGGTWSIVYSTVAGNTSDAIGVGGEIAMDDGSAATLGSIFAAGTPQNCSAEPGAVLESQGYNIDSGTTCGFGAPGDHVGTDPLLAALADNGGFTRTRALLAGSPAIDAGDSNICIAATLDQRGAPRQGICDIGAFEFGALAGGPPFQPPFQPPPFQPPPDEPTHLDDLPAPEVGKEVNVEAVKGTVLVAIPAGGAAHGRGARASQKGLKFVPLEEARQIPTGSFLDTKRGTVELVSATGAADKTQNGQFTSGLFQVLQSRKKREKGLTELRLKGASFKSCAAKRGKKASAAKLSSRTVRQLKANAKGRFRTRGNHSAATVRGTVWLTADRCDGTLTKVTRGTVAVRDFRRKKTVLVKAGKSYLAKAKG